MNTSVLFFNIKRFHDRMHKRYAYRVTGVSKQKLSYNNVVEVLIINWYSSILVYHFCKHACIDKDYVYNL